MNFYKILFASVLISITNYFAQDSLTISEIMFAPSQTNSEFIEIYNSSNDTINIEDFSFRYQTSKIDFIISPDSVYKIPPKTFAIIFEGDYDFINGVYSSLIPSNSITFIISDNSFGTSGMANSSDRNLSLINAQNDTVNSYTYSANNQNGFSDEKIILEEENLLTNWGNSKTLNGTPGFKNSVSPLENNLSIELTIPDLNYVESQSAKITAIIKNLGLITAKQFTVNIYDDKNLDTLAASTELVTSDVFANLVSGDSLEINYDIENLELRNYQIIAEVIFDKDEDNIDNKAAAEFIVKPKPISPGDIVINEIMYRPQNDESEWIELFNNTNEKINISGYKIFDNSSHATISNEATVIQPNSFLVISDDSLIVNYYEYEINFIQLNLPSLNNGGDNIVLKDNQENTIDSVNYLSDWGGEISSLERVDSKGESNDSENWSSAQFVRGTPSRINSIVQKQYDLGITELLYENEFGIVGEQFEIQTRLKNFGFSAITNSFLNIYFDSNKDSIFTNNEIIKTSQIPFIGAGDSLVVTEIINDFIGGTNFYKIEIDFPLDQFENNNSILFSFKGVEINLFENDVIVNEIMFAPSSNEPEWIEIINNSNERKNINGLIIADNSSSVKILSDELILDPNEILVIAKDSTILSKHEINSKLVFAQFPSLNNNGDKVVILDSLRRIIDSLEYKSTWNLVSGKSLERVDTKQSSTDSLNWKSSISEIGSTPGFINSTAKKEYDLEFASLSFEPQFPLEGENIKLKALIKNNGKQNSLFDLGLYLDEDLDSLANSDLELINNIFLAPNDSTEINFTKEFQVINREIILIGEIIFEQDEDLSNNLIYKSIAPGYEPNSIVINEIMSYPQTGDVEWVELFNRTDKKIDLKDWIISDILASPTKQIITEQNYFIQPEDFLIIGKDSSIFSLYELDNSKVIISPFPNLNNDQDGVVLKDRFSSKIDSVMYNSNWSIKKGYSLERSNVNDFNSDSSNWSASIDVLQSTPLRANSISEKDIDLIISVIKVLPENPKRDELILLEIAIKNLGRETSGNGNVKIEFLNSELPEMRYEFNPIESKDSIIITTEKFLIKDSLNIFAKINSINEDDSTNNYLTKTIYSGEGKGYIIISEIMFNPNPNQPEWIELYNTSENSINIKNWSLSDASSTISINEDLLINPGEFIIAINDSTYFADLDVKKIITRIPSLGNSEDEVVLKDFRNLTIDSVLYSDGLNFAKGFSIERVDLNNDSSNWISSIGITGSTPGRLNSVADYSESEFNSIIFNEIMYEPDSDNSEFVEIYNRSEDYINIGGWKILDQSNNITKVIPYKNDLAPKSFFTIAADSNLIFNYKSLHEDKYFINQNEPLSLANSGEKLILQDLKGKIIDSISYSSAFHNSTIKITKNKSLERINPNLSSNDKYNWSTSVNSKGATPSEENSIFTEGINSNSKIEISPNPFSPDNDGFEDFTIINYNLSAFVAQLRIRVFDSKGRLIRTILNNQSTGSSGKFIFDGLNDDGNPLKIGIYILLIEVLDSFSGTIEVFKKPIVIARKL